jgi:hypothetical protein
MASPIASRESRSIISWPDSADKWLYSAAVLTNIPYQTKAAQHCDERKF